MRTPTPASTTPATRIAPVTWAEVPPWARMPAPTHTHRGAPTDERGRRAEIARHPTVDDEQKADGGDAAHQDGQLGIEPHDDGKNKGRAEHRDHVLGTQPDRPRPGQPLIRTDHFPRWRC